MKVQLNVRDFLDRAVSVYPNRVGIIDEPDQPAPSMGSLTYREIGEHAAAMAAGLDALGVGPGERIAVLSHNSARLLISFFGVCGWGRVLVPINFRLHPEEVRYIVEQSGATVFLVDPELADAMADIPCAHTFVLGDESDAALFRFGTEPAAWESDEDATATLNYTSGTTARPKGVDCTHRQIWMNAAVFGWQASVSDRDVYLHTLPMFHCNGWGQVFSVTGMGGTHVVLRKVDGAEILRRIDGHGVTYLCAAPAVGAMVLDAAAAYAAAGDPVPGRDTVRMVMAGAPPPTVTIERVEIELGWEFIQIYGLTETSPLLTMSRGRAEWDDLSTHDRAVKLGRAGAPALGVELRIDDQGEVLARSNHVLKGYWEQPQATEEALEGGWFHTGDGGTIDDEGYLTISDRKKDVIITGGENVSSIEVEDVLFSHPSVVEVAVIGVPSDKWGETIKALVVLAPGVDGSDADAVAAELIAWCKSKLAGYKCPTSVEIREELSRTATGKLQKFRLRAPYWDGHTRQVN
ncbi:MAG: AMP-binding protein [Acidimicrobiales bacterium]